MTAGRAASPGDLPGGVDGERALHAHLGRARGHRQGHAPRVPLQRRLLRRGATRIQLCTKKRVTSTMHLKFSVPRSHKKLLFSMEASKTMVPMSSNASHGSSLSDLDRGWPVLQGDRWGGPQVPLLMEGTGAETRKRTVIACTDCRVCYIPIPAVRPPHEGQAPLTLRTAPHDAL